MKRIFYLASLVVTVIACNDSGSDNANTNTDSTNHSAHQADSNAVNTQPIDTSGMAGQSMMSMMQNMMDQMKTIQTSGNPDNDFAALMKAHHLGALEMAQMQVAKGADPQLKQMAQKMINDQQKEIAELNTFLSGHPAHGGGDGFHKEAMGIMNNMKMDMDHSGSIDRQFAQMMIPHHQTAIDMSRAYIKAGAHEEKLKIMANNIISAQQKEIKDLQAWLEKNK